MDSEMEKENRNGWMVPVTMVIGKTGRLVVKENCFTQMGMFMMVNGSMTKLTVTVLTII